MSPQEAYTELVKRTREISLLSSCASVLGWDERTYMPRGGGRLRADQLSLLAGLTHEQFTSTQVGDLIAAVESSPLVKDKESEEAVNVRELRYLYDKQTKLPKDLVEEITRVTTLAQGEWVIARKEKDFKRFLPWLEQVVDLTIKKAEAYGYEGEPYNALLDDYEPGMTVAKIKPVFADLRNDLVALLQDIQGAPNQPDVSIVEQSYDPQLQRIFGESVAAAIGFDFANGRLDVTDHPFCSGIGYGDTRITTRYNPNRLNDALFGTMHEAGHALYEMGLDKEKHFGTPMGESASLGIHESQSRMWENQVGRSKSFWVYFFPQAQRIFKDALHGVALDDFYGAINFVRPSYIRVEADEVTYNLHILLRFEMERAITTGDLKPKEVEGEWNSRFEKYFGLKVDNVSNGCIQDVHWSAGLFGYFPTYTLGNLYSAQFFNKASEDLGSLDDQFARGEFSPLREWLREKIHIQGSRYRAVDLAKKITGQELSHKPLIDYLRTKFSKIYGF